MNDETAARRLGRALRADGQDERTRRDAELTRLLWAARTGGGRRRRRSGSWLAGVAALVAGALFSLAWPVDPPLSYHVRGAARLDEGSVVADAGEPVELRFSDGSRLGLTPGARLRVDEVTAHGATLSLREGESQLAVVHRARTRWTLRAGPFQVAVVGTRFTTRWDAEHAALTVELHEGAVEVRGGSLATPLRLVAGQRLEASAQSWRIVPLAPVEPEQAAPAEPRAAGVAARGPERAVPVRDWARLLRRGDFASIVREAEAMGLERCLTRASFAELRMLADAARYTGRLALAERSLLALRRRAPGKAAAAAFFLGRLYESEGRGAEALAMYEQHLAEAPRGDYAEQAQAGRLRVLVQRGEVERAREAARQYLEAHPDGVHAASARRVLAPASAP
jgi:transmembrane sensor